LRTGYFASLSGTTGRILVDNESYLIVNHKKDSTEAIEIDLRKRLIKLYDNSSWTILPMNADHQFDENARIIKHIDEYGAVRHE